MHSTDLRCNELFNKGMSLLDAFVLAFQEMGTPAQIAYSYHMWLQQNSVLPKNCMSIRVVSFLTIIIIIIHILRTLKIFIIIFVKVNLISDYLVSICECITN